MQADAVRFSRRSAVAASVALALCPLAAASARRPAAGAAATSFAPALATIYTGQVEPAQCLVSEKYDGVRAVWDGRVLRHRSGRTVAVPAAFLAQLPPEPLDGELWAGRRRFDELSAIVRRASPSPSQWAAVRYMVFELPGAGGPFAERASRLVSLVASAASRRLVAAPQVRVADRAALQRRLEATVAAGGEGLMLHLAAAPYVGGRTDALMKLKPHLDAEAVVVGHHPGAGKYAGCLGALEVEAADGRRFLIGSGLSDELRRHPPPAGATLTYRYRDLTSSGLPRFATYLRRFDAL